MSKLSKTLLLLTVTVLLFGASTASAIPAFARKYQFSCSTCHAPFPRLKPFGEEFAARGFRMDRPEAEPPRATLDVGDPLLMLMRDFPIAARMEGFAAYHENAEAEMDFETPWVFKILSGGPLSQKVAYYLYFIVEKGETVGVEDAFLQYSGLFGSKVDLIFGQFQVSDPLFKRELRLERFDYDIYKVRIGEVDTNLTYDRGAMLMAGLPGDVDLVATVVNGNGIPTGAFDDDSNKNFALRAAREFGPVRVGAFGYAGTQESDEGLENRTTYFGPDLVVTGGDRWQLNAQYLRRSDDDPFFRGDGGNDVDTDGGFAEVHCFPRGHDGRYALSLLYNRVDSDDPAAESENVSLTFNYLLARNVRMLVDVGRDQHHVANTASIGWIAAF